MLLNFSEIFQKYNHLKPIRGVVHVGAHFGTESVLYQKFNISDVVWFEALPKTFNTLKENVGNIAGNVAFNVALSDVDGRTKFYVTDNGRGNNGSSSILPLGKHATFYPHVTVKEELIVETARFDTFMAANSIELSKYNFLNIDVQGAELHVIKGMGDLINGFDYVMAEINEAEFYKGGALLDDLEGYLKEHGFNLEMKSMTKYEWGDGLFVKTNDVFTSI